jgi:hypothetical protein
MFFNRKEALENKAITYNGRPCKYCGGTERYSSTTSCVPCAKALAKENKRIYTKNNADKVNAYNRKRYTNLSESEKLLRNRKQQLSLYGLTMEQYNVMLIEQNGVCKICGKPEKSSSKGVLSVDHDHSTGNVRGLLCDTCNRGLGHFYDNISLLYNAIEYLK